MQFPNPSFGWGLPDVTPGPRNDKLFFQRPGGYFDVVDTGLPKPSYPGLPCVDGGIGSRPVHPLYPGEACGMPHLPY